MVSKREAIEHSRSERAAPAAEPVSLADNEKRLRILSLLRSAIAAGVSYGRLEIISTRYKSGLT